MDQADRVLSTPPLSSSEFLIAVNRIRLFQMIREPNLDHAGEAQTTGQEARPGRASKRLSSHAREALYDRCRGDAEHPTCNICGQLVMIGEAWDESHDPEGPPRCFGGTETGIAHRSCNRRHGAQVVRPMDAKATRIRQRHIGAFQTRRKLPGGRTDWRKRKVNGEVVAR